MLPTPVILNPAARGSRAQQALRTIQAFDPPAEIVATQYEGHATELAESLARAGHPIVIAAGGDGTVNEVLQGIAKVNATRSEVSTHTALGVLPSGTMNVFAYELGFPSHRELQRPWQAITQGAIQTIDLWQANDRYFMQLAGVGFDADVVRRTTSEMKRRVGPLAYFLSGMASYFGSRPEFAVETADGRVLTGSQVFFGNGRNYGGRFPMLKHARMNDGLLDAVVLHGRVNVHHVAATLLGMMKDDFDADCLSYVQAERFTIHGDGSVGVELDGEWAGTLPVTIQRAPFPLRVACFG